MSDEQRSEVYACSFTITAIGYGCSETFFPLLFLQLILTIGESISLTHLLKFVSLLAPADKRGRYFLILGSYWDISRALGPTLGGLVFGSFGGQTLFLIVAFLLLLGWIGQSQLTLRFREQAVYTRVLLYLKIHRLYERFLKGMYKIRAQGGEHFQLSRVLS